MKQEIKFLSIFNSIKFKSVSFLNLKNKEPKIIINNKNPYLVQSFQKNKGNKFPKKLRDKMYPKNSVFCLMKIFIIISFLNQIISLFNIKRKLKSGDSFIILKTEILGLQYIISQE